MDVPEIDRIPPEIVSEAADIVLGFAKDLTNADAMIECVAKALEAKRSECELWKAQAYQVIGVLLDKACVWGSDEGVRALDYFAYNDEPDEEFLPWPIDQSYANPDYIPVKAIPE